MAKALCPECSELVRIADTGIAQDKRHSSRWWKVQPHANPRTGERCKGSDDVV